MEFVDTPQAAHRRLASARRRHLGDRDGLDAVKHLGVGAMRLVPFFTQLVLVAEPVEKCCGGKENNKVLIRGTVLVGVLRHTRADETVRLWMNIAREGLHPRRGGRVRLSINLLTNSDVQTEDGHAMKYGTFHSFQNLSHTVRGCNETVNKWAHTSILTCTCHRKPVEQW